AAFKTHPRLNFPFALCHRPAKSFQRTSTHGCHRRAIKVDEERTIMMTNNYGEEQLPPQYYQPTDFGEEEDDEMPATEKDLAEDAPWKKIQQNTFTRWCNEHLKCVNKTITDLQRDFSDGLKLISLLEVLSQKKMYRKHHTRPNFRQMKLENVSVALEFLDREHIKLVSIGELLLGFNLN
ncbi:hypothetical protein XENOCAPTIV_022603, partial [Xenoophorus captivus]